MSTVMRSAALWGAVLSFLLPVTGGMAQEVPVMLEQQQAVSIIKLAPGEYLLDYGRVAFGNLQLQPEPGSKGRVTLRFGESLRDGRIDRNPPGSVRYAEATANFEAGAQVAAPPANARNTRPPAVLTPAAWGVVIPFRWLEVEGWPGKLEPTQIRRRAAFDSTWQDKAASFHSSDPMLDRIWELSHYSIKATTFAGVFVDGDRERIAYEADAYLTQLSYYAGDPSPRMARHTFERLMKYPTWPSEWAPHMVFMAYADWMQTGDRTWLERHFEWLKTKTLEDRVGEDHLVHSNPEQVRHNDLVDWPAGERDHYVFTPINTVVNAFHLRAVEEMHLLALALGRQDDAEAFAAEEREGTAAFQRAFFDKQKGLYRDGVDTSHISLHANLFSLAFGLVPEAQRPQVAQWLAQQGMQCSVYAAQYLMEGLFENGAATATVGEMTADGDRSWKHMVDSGTTITWEAWDQKFKPNQDWNHAWGAAPANLLPRFVLGVQVSAPGWKEAIIEPHSGGLSFASGTVPTTLGPIDVSWKQEKNFRLAVNLPAGMTARLRLPAAVGSHGVWLNGRQVPARFEQGVWILRDRVEGKASLVVR